MNQIIITPKSEQEHSFVMEMLKRMEDQGHVHRGEAFAPYDD